jgi:hypothetical protein
MIIVRSRKRKMHKPAGAASRSGFGPANGADGRP